MNTELLSQAYKDWMETIGYNTYTIKGNYLKTRDFLIYLNTQDISQIHQITPKHIQDWYTIQKQRKSHQTGKLLSNRTLNSYQTNLRLFSSYLHQTEQGSLEIQLTSEPEQAHQRQILTQAEINDLYTAAENSFNPLGNRVLLHLYYGCGLRRNEGIRLNKEDVQPEKGILYIKHGKGYKSRYIPLTESHIADFKTYLKTIENDTEPAFLRGETGKRMSRDIPNRRLKKLIRMTTNPQLQTKTIGLHTLRHSIATHLLQNGMEIELISKLLGHAFLDTTQIYLNVECKM